MCALMSGVHEDDPLSDLPMTQFRCLITVWRHPKCRMAEVADMLGTKMPALSQVVNRLVKRALLARCPDKSDGRVVRLEVTGKADALLSAHEQKKDARLRSAVSALKPGDREQVLAGLRLLAEAAEDTGEGSINESSIDNDPLESRVANARL